MRFLLILLFALPALGQYPVIVRLKPPTSVDAEKRVTWTVELTNRTDAPIENLHYYFSGGGSTVVSAPADCNMRESPECTINLPARATREATFTVVERNLNPYGIAQAVAEASGMALVAYDQGVLGREFFVTSTADSGPGTLRQAITDINRECAEPGAPCVVRFAIDGPVPSEGWFTIALHAPLPTITASDVFIDGGSQSRHTGETNPFGGPEILLDGRVAGEGNGLAFTNASARVTDMAIGGFRGNGIEARVSWGMFFRNYIGVDPTGRAALPNTGRGIAFNDGIAYVVDNVLSANGRAGGFFWTAYDVKAFRNFVGVGADGVTPLRNGASGLFFHKPRVSYWASAASENVIGYNAHAGIGLSRNATGAFGWNTFRDNGAGPIDVGLDGVTGVVMGLPGQGGVIGAPTITSAQFENGVTTVTVRPAPGASTTSANGLITIYAGTGDTQELVANLGWRDGLTARIPRDLRGQAVRAVTYTMYIYNWDDPAPGTSEMSEPRVVE